MPNRIPSAGLAIAWLTALCFVVAIESERIRVRLEGAATTGDWSGTPAPDATFILPVLLLGPFCWLFPTRNPGRDDPWSDRMRRSSIHGMAGISGITVRWKLVGFAVVGLLSLAVSASTAGQIRSATDSTPFAETVPAMHDELSYLLQAKTILAGRWWWPGPERTPELFHQVHVLNEGRFASRYLPGTGAWIAPFLALDRPIWGHWLAGAIVSGMVFLIGCKIGDAAVGSIAGAFTALAPGMGIFSNLLLAHHPALIGLTVFIWAFAHMMGLPRIGWAIVAGTGLAFAMLCRPMTAATIGLPFGLWHLGKVAREIQNAGSRNSDRRFLRCAIGLGAPLLIGFTIVAVQNEAITGSIWTTPYGLYTRIYTPRHVYGFNNGIRGDSSQGVKVLTDYDHWAQNLTPALALENAGNRLRCSFEWTLGIAPLAMAALIFLANWKRSATPWKLIFASIVSLHVFHIPYWLDGILHYHYVFESGPLWLLLFAHVSMTLIRSACQRGCGLFLPWWIALGAVSAAANLCAVARGETVPRVRAGIVQAIPNPQRYRRFRQAVTESSVRKPALILVQAAPADLHVEYVRNDPPFDSDVLVGRHEPGRYDAGALRAQHPDRTIYLYNTNTSVLRPLINGD